jgi:hypothetical protein
VSNRTAPDHRGRDRQRPRDQPRAGHINPSPPAEDQVSPHNDEAERIVLGAMMLSAEVIPEIVDTVSSADFYRPAHATLYAAITAAYAGGEPVEPVALATRLASRGDLASVGGTVYLHQLLQAVPTAVNGPFYAGLVRDRSVERRLLADVVDLQVAIRAGDLRLQLGDPQSRLNKSLANFQGEIGAATAAATVQMQGVEPLDWVELWNRDFDDIDWLIEPLIERGQSISLVGGAKAGKSLLTLECVAALATGRSVLGGPPGPPLRVLYVDQENTPQDVYRRLSAMGYRPEHLANLVYLSFANLPPLNTPAGAAALMSHVERHQSEVVVLDTISRMVVGEENSSDTWLELYRYTLVELKARRISTLRLDHHGKDAERGARGSSAKQGDIDAEWELTATGDNRLRLRRTLSRGGMGDGTVELIRHQFPLRHEAVGRQQACAADIENAIAHLDGAGAALDISRRKAAEVLRQVGVAIGNNKIAEAVKVRRERAESGTAKIRTTSSDATYSTTGTEDQDHPSKNAGQPGPDLAGTTRYQSAQGKADRWSPVGPHVSGDHRSGPQDHPAENDDLDRWPTIPPPPSGRTDFGEPPAGRWLGSGRPA